MDANRRASLDYLQDLEKFVKQRMKDKMVLKIPDLVYDDREDMVERLGDQGWYQHDWSERRLTREELSSALESMATLHAAGLAFRMSNKKNHEKQYPSLIPDLFTSNLAKELIAKHIDSYLHCLSCLPGVEKTVCKLRMIQPNVFQHLVALRRPNDELGSR